MSDQFKPSLKQYKALMYLGIIPLKKLKKMFGKYMWVQQYDERRNILFDDVTTELGFGGAAGGGKSYLGCKWISLVARRYPGTRRFIAREELKRLKGSTLLTLFEVFQKEGMKRDRDYKYNNISGEVTIINDLEDDSRNSTIMLLGLEFQPSDPLYSRFGSMEFTGGFIDEANECEEAGFEILKTRIRFKLERFCQHCAGDLTLDDDFLQVDKIKNPDPVDVDDEFIEKNRYLCPSCNRETYGLTPKVLCTFNPDKGWVYQRFYKPRKEGKLKSFIKFIPSLATDNPNLPKTYIQNLKKLKDNIMKQRLLYGNFDYDDTPGRLFEYDSLLGMFNRETEDQILAAKYLEEPKFKAIVDKHGRGYLTGYEYKIVSDPARHGRDLAVIMVWNKFSIEEMVVYFKSDIDQLENEIIRLQDKYFVATRDTIVDEDGVGGGLKDSLKCRGFINNASAIQPKKAKRNPLNRVNYQNLKTQCYFEIPNHIDKIAISLNKLKVVGGEMSEEEVRKRIIEELDVIVEVDIDKDGPKKIISKKDIKAKIGRSPDFGDCFAMRMFWEVKRPTRAFTY